MREGRVERARHRLERRGDARRVVLLIPSSVEKHRRDEGRCVAVGRRMYDRSSSVPNGGAHPTRCRYSVIAVCARNCLSGSYAAPRATSNACSDPTTHAAHWARRRARKGDASPRAPRSHPPSRAREVSARSPWRARRSPCPVGASRTERLRELSRRERQRRRREPRPIVSPTPTRRRRRRRIRREIRA